MPNPFFFGNPVPPEQFIGRSHELRRIVGRILNQGQSTAVVGEPRSGKTSLLLYLKAPETRDELYGERSDQLLFSYLDAHTFGNTFTQVEFWKHALRPLRIKLTHAASPLGQAYRTCREDQFGTFVLERLLAQMRADNLRLVLLVNQFDVLLHHEVLNCTEFFGGLRALASRSRGALALVIGSRRPLTTLNRETQDLSRTGSPYFNFMDEVILRPLSSKAVSKLLDRAGELFTTEDRRYLSRVAGGHPYLLQMAASEMWMAYSEGIDDRFRRWQQVGERLYGTAALTLSDTWRLWSSAMKRAFTSVAIADVSSLLEQRKFYMLPLIRDARRDCGPELRMLCTQGFITKDDAMPTGYHVRPQAFLWWMADEIVRMARDEKPVEAWLRAQELGVMLTKGEKEQLHEAVRTIGEMLRGGATILIETAAKGIGAALIN
jgi:hypothetical protein